MTDNEDEELMQHAQILSVCSPLNLGEAFFIVKA